MPISPNTVPPEYALSMVAALGVQVTSKMTSVNNLLGAYLQKLNQMTVNTAFGGAEAEFDSALSGAAAEGTTGIGGVASGEVAANNGIEAGKMGSEFEEKLAPIDEKISDVDKQLNPTTRFSFQGEGENVNTEMSLSPEQKTKLETEKKELKLKKEKLNRERETKNQELHSKNAGVQSLSAAMQGLGSIAGIPRGGYSALSRQYKAGEDTASRASNGTGETQKGVRDAVDRFMNVDAAQWAVSVSRPV